MKKLISTILIFVLTFSFITYDSSVETDAKSNWKTLYKNYLSKESYDNYNECIYYLIYLDNNSIPEVLRIGPNARVMELYFIVGNKVKTYSPYGYVFAYIPKGGKFFTEFAHMGDVVCSLDKFNGKQVSNIHSCSYYSSGLISDDEITDCKFDNKPVSYIELKNKYNTEIAKKLKKAENVDDICSVSYCGKDAFISKALK